MKAAINEVLYTIVVPPEQAAYKTIFQLSHLRKTISLQLRCYVIDIASDVHVQVVALPFHNTPFSKVLHLNSNACNKLVMVFGGFR